MKDKTDAGCGASICFMARDVTAKYLSQIHWLLENLEISVACNASDQRFFTDSIHQVTQYGQANTHPILPTPVTRNEL